MAYIPKYLQWTRDDARRSIMSIEDGEHIPPSFIVGVHFAHHSKDDNFDDGLSLLDLLYNKLKVPFKLDWNVERIKQVIRGSANKEEALLQYLKTVLTKEMIAYYGI